MTGSQDSLPGEEDGRIYLSALVPQGSSPIISLHFLVAGEWAPSRSPQGLALSINLESPK